MKKIIKENSNLIIIIFFLFMIFILINDIIGSSILNNSNYNTYELQVKAWLNGNVFLDHNYEYLELAIYKGHYYVSFPPFPSVFLLPFVIIFKDSIPTNLISFMLFVGCFVVIYRILRKYNWKEFDAILLGLAFTMGTNLIFLSLDSGVWFLAQLLNYFLCLLSDKGKG